MRTVVCYDMMASREVDQAHCSDPAPVGVEKCAAHPCAAWIPHNWTSCSVTCGMVIVNYLNSQAKTFIKMPFANREYPSALSSVNSC
jgi:hypothetical protein